MYRKGVSMSEFALCIDSESNPASLIMGKVYPTLSDTEARTRGLLRVLDEDMSGQTGISIRPPDLPEAAKRALAARV